ncbi:hypothetical protein [Halococcus sediminicola]|uniref:hypothetical protein n=1 Tax=Halococcus sediminicola TaxID=1264579 RepID=UPI000B1ADBD6|nr:hypothetical protein [Halococcus sediminicola]
MTAGESWLKDRGIDELEECEATQDDEYVLLQHESKRSDEWLRFEGETVEIRR